MLHQAQPLGWLVGPDGVLDADREDLGGALRAAQMTHGALLVVHYPLADSTPLSTAITRITRDLSDFVVSAAASLPGIDGILVSLHHLMQTPAAECYGRASRPHEIAFLLSMQLPAVLSRSLPTEPAVLPLPRLARRRLGSASSTDSGDEELEATARVDLLRAAALPGMLLLVSHGGEDDGAVLPLLRRVLLPSLPPVLAAAAQGTAPVSAHALVGLLRCVATQVAHLELDVWPATYGAVDAAARVVFSAAPPAASTAAAAAPSDPFTSPRAGAADVATLPPLIHHHPARRAWWRAAAAFVRANLLPRRRPPPPRAAAGGVGAGDAARLLGATARAGRRVARAARVACATALWGGEVMPGLEHVERLFRVSRVCLRSVLAQEAMITEYRRAEESRGWDSMQEAMEKSGGVFGVLLAVTTIYATVGALFGVNYRIPGLAADVPTLEPFFFITGACGLSAAVIIIYFLGRFALDKGRAKPSALRGAVPWGDHGVS